MDPPAPPVQVSTGIVSPTITPTAPSGPLSLTNLSNISGTFFRLCLSSVFCPIFDY